MKPKTAKSLFFSAAAILLAAIFAIPPAAAGLPFSDVEAVSYTHLPEHTPCCRPPATMNTIGAT